MTSFVMTKAADEKRQRSERRGRLAETCAVLWLRFKGYRIRARRFRCPMGELDIVATRGNALVFVEVKARQTMAEAAAALTPHQQERLRHAAKWYLARQTDYRNVFARFDVILLAPWRWPHHISNAFPAE